MSYNLEAELCFNFVWFNNHLDDTNDFATFHTPENNSIHAPHQNIGSLDTNYSKFKSLDFTKAFRDLSSLSVISHTVNLSSVCIAVEHKKGRPAIYRPTC